MPSEVQTVVVRELKQYELIAQLAKDANVSEYLVRAVIVPYESVNKGILGVYTYEDAKKAWEALKYTSFRAHAAEVLHTFLSEADYPRMKEVVALLDDMPPKRREDEAVDATRTFLAVTLETEISFRLMSDDPFVLKSCFELVPRWSESTHAILRVMARKRGIKVEHKPDLPGKAKLPKRK